MAFGRLVQDAHAGTSWSRVPGNVAALDLEDEIGTDRSIAGIETNIVVTINPAIYTAANTCCRIIMNVNTILNDDIETFSVIACRTARIRPHTNSTSSIRRVVMDVGGYDFNRRT